MKIRISQRGSPAPVVHHLRPLITYSSPAERSRLDVGRIARRHGGLGHRKRRADSPLEERHQPALALLIRSIAHQHFHVSRIGRGAVECFRPERGASP